MINLMGQCDYGSNSREKCKYCLRKGYVCGNKLDVKQYEKVNESKVVKSRQKSVEYGNRTKGDFHKLSDLVLWVEEQVPHLEGLDSTMKFVIQVLSRMHDGFIALLDFK
jgi:hypothetical protein